MGANVKYDIAIIGGDKRTACMAPILAEKGYKIICYCTLEIPASVKYHCNNTYNNRIFYASSLKEALDNTQIIICGIPFLKDRNLYIDNCKACPSQITLSEFQRCLHKKQKIFAGVIPADFSQICEERNICCYDFMKDEPLTLFNAVATAEGAILEALMHRDSCLHRSNVLVMGYGRCGKTLADKLKGLSACVTVCSNSDNELALASSLGMSTLPLSKLVNSIGNFEYIFNTIPACVITKQCLAATRCGCIIIDIASNRIGIDYSVSDKYNCDCHYCPGLPGKYSCWSCAKILSNFVIERI
ncbi:MAG: dipicolinate synthase [Lachnospiraceae bacterium]|nr:dipicolinate synthase [Lachnospiraceae bacterium]MBQ2115375.1 dipicolinate synthase [Lachnospiraceae bacterium]MBQ2406517.1 dipicolinate synthase [Lachnospiraceae bacterium]MBQ5850520.1 dipicolinate synthase [Lachnospiraceae bacterium]MEE0919072.1 dipicolinate synthase subunit DpsA [Lachnospiraceae bacterium]